MSTSRDGTRAGAQHAEYLPSPAEIAQRAAQIRANWSPHRLARLPGRPGAARVTIPCYVVEPGRISAAEVPA